MGLSAPLFTTRSPSRSRSATCEIREAWVAGMAAGIRIRLRRIVQNRALDARERQLSTNRTCASPRPSFVGHGLRLGHHLHRQVARGLVARGTLCCQKIKKIAHDSFSFGHE